MGPATKRYCKNSRCGLIPWASWRPKEIISEIVFIATRRDIYTLTGVPHIRIVLGFFCAHGWLQQVILPDKQGEELPNLRLQIQVVVKTKENGSGTERTARRVTSGLLRFALLVIFGSLRLLRPAAAGVGVSSAIRRPRTCWTRSAVLSNPILICCTRI